MINNNIQLLLANILENYANKLKTNNSNVTSEEATNIISNIAHIELTKPEVCDKLNISRSRFDDLVREGKLPKGRSIKHKRNIVWYKDDLMFATNSVL